MKRNIVLMALTCLIAFGCKEKAVVPFVSQEEMSEIYEQVKVPYKYGFVVLPLKEGDACDAPTVFRHNDKWFMIWSEFDGRGYETFLSDSDDLVHWEYLGKILGYREGKWDAWQRAGYLALQDYQWGGSYELEKFDGKYWMGNLGGALQGYETDPLSIGIAFTDDAAEPKEWDVLDAPVLSINDDSVQWFDNGTLYRSYIMEDKEGLTGHRFLMYYNARGTNPESGISAERMGIAFSEDMVSWERYEQNPVLANEIQGTITADGTIQKIGDLYVMFYFRAFVPGKPYAAFNSFACSRDLLHWYPWEGEDLIYPTEDYDNMFAHKGYVINWKGNTYYFYNAVDTQGHRAIALATSAPMGHSALSF